MAVDRFLGAGWASVHGPADSQAMILWALDEGFRGLLQAPAPRAVPWLAMHRGKASLPFSFCAIRVSPSQAAAPPLEAGLASTKAGDQALAQGAIAQAVSLARSLACERVILDPGLVPVPGEVPFTDLGDPTACWDSDSAGALMVRRNARLDRALEALCRALHRVCKDFPDMTFCLSTSRHVLGLGEHSALQSVFEDLPRARLGYWHDTAAAACRKQFLGEEPGQILEVGSKRLLGMTLGDFADGRVGFPPGAGGVDYPLLSAYRQPVAKGFPVVIDLDPTVEPGEIPGIHSFLDKFGL